MSAMAVTKPTASGIQREVTIEGTEEDIVAEPVNDEVLIIDPTPPFTQEEYEQDN